MIFIYQNNTRDTLFNMTMLSIAIDGRVDPLECEITLSSAGDGAARLGCVAFRFTDALHCTIAADNEEPLVSVSSCEDDEWIAMPGARQDRRMLAVDVPGWTICYDACTNERAGWGELRAVKVLRHGAATAKVATAEVATAKVDASGESIASSDGSQGSSSQGSGNQGSDSQGSDSRAACGFDEADCVDASDSSALPSLAAAEHGDWLRDHTHRVITRACCHVAWRM